MGYIYCITNLVNQKKYVGKTTYIHDAWLSIADGQNINAHNFGVAGGAIGFSYGKLSHIRIEHNDVQNYTSSANNLQREIEENVNNTSSESPKNIEASSAPFEVNVIQNDDYIQQIKLNLMKSINKKSTAMKSTSKTKLKSGNKNIQSKYKSSNKPSININNSINYVQYSITPNSKELNKVKTGGINANQI